MCVTKLLTIPVMASKEKKKKLQAIEYSLCSIHNESYQILSLSLSFSFIAALTCGYNPHLQYHQSLYNTMHPSVVTHDAIHIKKR